MPIDEDLVIAEEVAAGVRGLLARRADLDVARQIATTSEGHDPTLWSELASTLGVHGLFVPAGHGGDEAGPHVGAAVFRELGTVLLPGPYFSTLGQGVSTLIEADPSVLRNDVLRQVATGESTVATVGGGAVMQLDGSDRLTGSAADVLGARGADWLIVQASDASGVTSAYLVSGAEVTVDDQESVDASRRFGTVTFETASGMLLAGPGRGAELLRRGAVTSAHLLAAEQLGAARANLNAVIAYARVREQFGRAIGSFQAVKHRLADAYVQIVRLDTLLALVLREVQDGTVDEVRAALLLEQAGRTARFVADASIQIHGGIGFTWEHSAHLFLRRALADDVLLIPPAQRRQVLSSALLQVS